MILRFYYDIVCPYAYLASLRIEAVAERTGATLEWHPVLLGGLYRHHETADVPAQRWTPNKVKLGVLDLHREANAQQAPFQDNARHPQRSVTAMRLLTIVSGDLRVSMTKALYAAYWVDNLDINSPEVLGPIAKTHGISLDDVNEPDIKLALRTHTDAAAKAGVFGVPTCEVGGQLWWGQDRLHLVEQALGGSPIIEPQINHKSTGTKISFFHDFSSPFSYLASTQIDRIAQERGAQVEWKPILLGALFKSIDTPNVPLFAMSQAKQAYMLRDLHDWAQWWGVDFSFPNTFPIRTVLALRVAIIEPTVTPHLYRAVWVDGQDIGDPETLRSILDAAGFNGDELIAHTQDSDIKTALRDNTTQAEQVGACGVPTASVGNTLFWGQDRLHRMAEAL